MVLVLLLLWRKICLIGVFLLDFQWIFHTDIFIGGIGGHVQAFSHNFYRSFNFRVTLIYFSGQVCAFILTIFHWNFIMACFVFFGGQACAVILSFHWYFSTFIFIHRFFPCSSRLFLFLVHSDSIY
uniref:Uncharacterized protein n=1 Tax=Oryza nivara TaxID=4536 RepID=A0A0E0HUB9_ORYNI